MYTPIKEYLNQDLAGWMIVYGWTVSLVHDVWGHFPLIKAETGEPVVFLDESTALAACKTALKERRSSTQINPTTLLVNKRSREALIPFKSEAWTRVGARLVLKEDLVDDLLVPGAFVWPLGLSRASSVRSRDFASQSEVSFFYSYS